MYKVEFSNEAEDEIIKEGINKIYLASLVFLELKKQGISFGDIILPISINDVDIMLVGDIREKKVRIFNITKNIIKVKE